MPTEQDEFYKSVTIGEAGSNACLIGAAFELASYVAPLRCGCHMSLQARREPISFSGKVDASQVERDVATILWTLRMHAQRRYLKQRFWEEESKVSDYASRLEGHPRLESVSEHSWHVAFIAGLLASRFPELDGQRCIETAILHDILEIIMGDKSPLGRDGTGRLTHAFNLDAEAKKTAMEEGALTSYLRRLPSDLVVHHREMIIDYMFSRTREALFIKSIDKLQSLAYVSTKKDGRFQNRHLIFTYNYSMKGCSYFPELKAHYDSLWQKIFERIAEVRSTTATQIYEIVRRNQADAEYYIGDQLSLFAD